MRWWGRLKAWWTTLFNPLRPSEIRTSVLLWRDRNQAMRDNMQFIRNMLKPGNVKENTMSKKRRAKLLRTDAPKPKILGGSLGLCSPIPLNMQPQDKVKVKMGLSADTPLLVFSYGVLEKRGVVLLNPGAVDCDKEIVLEIQNVSGERVVVDAGDVLAKASILDTTDIEVA